MPQSRKQPKNFEERLKRLEELSALLKEGKTSLEEATGFFEEGIRLARGLEKDLSRIERRIEMLVNEPTEEDDKPELELFPELDENGKE